MTLRSRLVLDDCKRAHALADEATAPQELRLHLVAGIALARAVGHVLRNVDSRENPAVAEANAAAFESWKANRTNNAIYWDFILRERNLVLKQYDLNWVDDPVPLVASGKVFVLDECLYCPIESESFAGEDFRDMLQQAISWWESQLDAIERTAGRNRRA